MAFLNAHEMILLGVSDLNARKMADLNHRFVMNGCVSVTHVRAIYVLHEYTMHRRNEGGSHQNPERTKNLSRHSVIVGVYRGFPQSRALPQSSCHSNFRANRIFFLTVLF